jgi:hypothetical protein
VSVATAEPTQLKTNIKKLKRDNAKLIKGLAAEWAVAWQKLDMKNIDKSTPTWMAQAQQVTTKYQKSAEELANAYVGTWGLVGEPPEPLPKPQLNASLLVTGPLQAKHSLSKDHDEQKASDTGKLQSLGAATRHVLDTERSVITNTAKKAPGMAGWQRVGSGTSTCKFCTKIIDGGVTQTEPVFKSHDHCHCVPQMVTAEQQAALDKEAKNKAKRVRATKREIKKLQAQIAELTGLFPEELAKLQARLAKLQTKLHELENPGPAEDLTPQTLADQKAAAAKLAEAEELAKKKAEQEAAAKKLEEDQLFHEGQLKQFGEDSLYEYLKDTDATLTEPEAKWLAEMKVKKAAEEKAKIKAEEAALKKAQAAADKAAKKAAVELAKTEALAADPKVLEQAKANLKYASHKLTAAQALALFKADPAKALSKYQVVKKLPDDFEPKKKLLAAIRAKKAAGNFLNSAENQILIDHDPTTKAKEEAEALAKKQAAKEARERLAALQAASREGLEKLLADPDTEYRRFADGREKPRFGTPTITSWREATKVHTSSGTSLPESVERAISSYRGSGYRAMNEVLRSTGGDTEAKTSVRVLSEAIAERPIPASAVVYRGVKNSTGRYNAVKVGDRITDTAFMSTSVEERTAINFSGYYTGGENKPVVFEIYTPQGTPVLTGDLGPNQQEHELIFGPNTSYEITSITERDGRWWIRAVIVKTPIRER